MDSADFDLGRLLAPIGVEAFLRDTWERQPLEIHRDAGAFYAGVFSLADIDSVIAFSRPRFTEPGAFPGGSPPSRTYVQGWLPDQLLAPAEVYPGIADLRRVYAQGKTVIIRAMQHRWPPIARLCRNLEAAFHCPVHANLYLTPPHAQGFDAHIDGHEVFALQLDGVKTWRLYGQAAVLPLAREKANIARSRLGPPREICLKPGDLLYLPRGHAHDACTAETFSLHLTVGVNIYRWADVLHQAIEEMSHRDTRFRESVPPGALMDASALPAFGERVRELLGVLADDARPEDAAQRLGGEFLDGLAMLPGAHFVPRHGMESLNLDSVLGKTPGVVCRVLVDGDSALIQFPGGQVVGPARIASALQLVARSDRSFAIRELPDGLGDEGKVVLARRLVREGLLTIAEAEHNAPHETPAAITNVRKTTAQIVARRLNPT